MDNFDISSTIGVIIASALFVIALWLIWDNRPSKEAAVTPKAEERKTMDTTSSGQPEAYDGAAMLSSLPSFDAVPDVCWVLVSAFVAPPDAYNLCLSSKHFFRSDTSDAGKQIPGSQVRIAGLVNAAQHNGKVGIVLTNATSSSGRVAVKLITDGSMLAVKLDNLEIIQPVKMGGSSLVLATRLLKSSLLSSLGRVLEHSKSGITLESALAMAELPKGSALIAGSSIVQTCLGQIWTGKYGGRPTDVDIFCSAKAAPQVRSWLVEKANCMFTGFRDTYIDMVDERLLYTLDTSIHHVEHWGSIVQCFVKNESRRSYLSEKDMKEYQDKHGIDAIKDSEYYKQASAHGKNCQKNYVDWKWKNGTFDLLGVDQNKAYNIKPQKGSLPFDFDGVGNIDLIVARVSKTPLDLLEDFDITICKASFNGRNFRIPNPHQTFTGKSMMEPNRSAVVKSYVKNYTPPNEDYFDIDHPIGIYTSAHANTIIDKVRKEVPSSPFYRQLDFAAAIPDRYNPNIRYGIGSFYDETVQAKYAASVQFHNWTTKLIHRLRKYQERGIEVVGAPMIADDFEIEQMEIEWHGG